MIKLCCAVFLTANGKIVHAYGNQKTFYEADTHLRILQ